MSDTIEEGVALAKKTLQSGKATEVLQTWIETSQEIAKASSK